MENNIINLKKLKPHKTCDWYFAGVVTDLKDLQRCDLDANCAVIDIDQKKIVGYVCYKHCGSAVNLGYTIKQDDKI